jgi:hypothetical protein
MDFKGWEFFLDGEADGSLRIPLSAVRVPVDRGLVAPPHRRVRSLHRRHRGAGRGVGRCLTLMGCLRLGQIWLRGSGQAWGPVRAAAVASVGRQQVTGRCSGARVPFMAAATGSWKEMPCRGEAGRMVLSGCLKARGGLSRLLEEEVFVGAAGRAATSEEVAGACMAVAEGVTRKGRATMGGHGQEQCARWAWCSAAGGEKQSSTAEA